MAYNKKTWKARQGLGLNKFSIDGATPVPIVNQPDSVTQQGDALSAGNLNDLEQRIADAFDDVEESEDVLQSQINQHDSRLENLEQKAGDYSIVQYRGTDAVPTGKAKNGLVEKIVGKTRAWNQILPPSAQGSTVVNDVTIASDGNGAYTLNGTASSYIYTTIKSRFQNDMVVGHKYLIFCNSPSGNVYLADSYSNKFDVNSAAIFDYTTAVTIWIGLHVMGGATVNETVKPMVRDLTLIFGAGNEPSTVADALAQLPALGQYNAYDAGSLVDETLSGVRSVGRNLFNKDDFTLFNGYVASNGVLTASASGEKTFICKALPLQAYYLIRKESYGRIASYTNSPSDGDAGTVMSSSYSTALTFNTLAETAYLAISFRNNTGNTFTYEEDIEGMYLGYGTSGSFTPYKTDTLSLSETVTLRGVGTCVETLDVETGVRDDGKFGNVDLSTMNFTQYDASSPYYYSSDLVSVINAPASNNNVANVIASKYVVSSRTDMSASLEISVSNGGVVWVSSGVGVPPTGTLLYEKATYTPSSPIAPITDNFIEVEGGGTIDTIQEQSPVIDNGLDVGYLTL